MDSQNKGGGVLTKKCSKCLKRRALSSFRKDPRYRLGVFCWCNKCVAEKALERFHKNRDVLNERQRRYRRENADHERRREQDYRRRTGRSGVSYSNEKYQAIKERAGLKMDKEMSGLTVEQAFAEWAERRGVWPRLTHEEIFRTAWNLALSDRGGEAVAIVGENQVLEWAPPYIRPPVGTKLYTRPQVGHLAPDSDPSSHRRCKCEFSGGGVLAKTCDFHRRLLAAQVSENAAQEGASSQLSNNGSSRRLGAETSEDAPPAAAPPAAGEVRELADRLEQYIPDGDGHNGEYAKTLTAAVAFLRGGSLE